MVNEHGLDSKLKNYTLLAFDPAAEASVSDTGFALLEYTENTAPRIIQAGVVHGGYEGFTGWLRDNPIEVDTVVCEQFIHYNAAADISPLLIEGAIRYVYPDTILQPSSVLGMVTEQHLKDVGFWTGVGHHQDANSAIRHAVYWLRSQRHTPTLKMLSCP